MTVRLTIDVPGDALAVLREGPHEFGLLMREAAVVKWYELGMVSQSKGAEILSMTRAEFLRLLAKYRVSACQVEEKDRAMEFGA